jgi:hypothetical protein
MHVLISASSGIFLAALWYSGRSFRRPPRLEIPIRFMLDSTIATQQEITSPCYCACAAPASLSGFAARQLTPQASFLAARKPLVAPASLERTGALTSLEVRYRAEESPSPLLLFIHSAKHEKFSLSVNQDPAAICTCEKAPTAWLCERKPAFRDAFVQLLVFVKLSKFCLSCGILSLQAN